MVQGVDVVVEEGGAESISPGADHEVASLDVSLESSGLKSGKMLAGRYEDFSSKMSTFLHSWLLILDVDASRTCINEHLN
jgi:hypothetical protein